MNLRVFAFAVILISLLTFYRACGLKYFYTETVGTTDGISGGGFRSTPSVNYKFVYENKNITGSNSVPQNINQIELQNGKYKVRVFKFIFCHSWMDFSKPVE